MQDPDQRNLLKFMQKRFLAADDFLQRKQRRETDGIAERLLDTDAGADRMRRLLHDRQRGERP